MPPFPHTTRAHDQPNRRHRADRRCGHEQRAEIRFEPNAQNRRIIAKRRRADTDHWQAASREH